MQYGMGMTEKTIHERVTEHKAALAAVNRERADLQALSLLIDNNGVQPAPHSIDLIAPDYQIVTVGIGKDHTATILITTSDMRALHHVLGQENNDEG